ncbi:MAG: anti-sigma factor [Alphaproteobacteria bacterium]
MARPDPEMRQLMAAEYALGTLRGAARRRFEKLRADDAVYCRDADEWENRLNLLAEAVPDVVPPDSVWRRIEQGIDMSTVRSWWNSPGFWRGVSAVSAAAAAALLALFIQTRPVPPPAPAIPSQVAVLNDQQQLPAWIIRSDFAGHVVSVESLRPQDQPAGTSYELWLIPSTKGQPPVSLGLIAGSGDKKIALNPRQFDSLRNAAAMAVSLEPTGGSPTGLPTGPVLYQGALVGGSI